MPNFKTTYIFNSCRQGWSETWYHVTTNYDSVFNTIVLGGFASRRAALTGKPTLLEAVRISDDDVLQDSMFKTLDLNAAVQDSRSDTAWNALLIRVNAGPLYRRQMYLRGIPDSWIDRSLDNLCNFSIPTVATDAFNNFAQFVVAVPTYIKAISKEPPLMTEVDVTGIADQGGKVKLLEVGSNALKGETIRSKKWTGPDKNILRGVFKVLDVVTGGIVIDLDFNKLTNPAADVNGKVRSRKYTFQRVTSLQLLRPVKRSTGRAFFVPRGRRPVKRT